MAMFRKLWPKITLADFNDWKPVSGIVNAIPYKYSQFFETIDEWFETFALRAQNDCNAYLDFIFNRFEFETFTSAVQETVIDMVYVMVEHWIFNRTPIEFFVSATTSFSNTGMNHDATSYALNAEDLLPQRMKILARFTELKEFFSVYDDTNGVDPSVIDLEQYLSKEQIKHFLKLQEKNISDKLDKNLKINLETDIVTVKSNLEIFVNRLQENFTQKIEKEWKDKIIADATKQIASNKDVLKQIAKNALNKIAMTFIGQICWFASKKMIASGWLLLRDESQIVILSDGSEINVPKINDDYFISHSSKNEMIGTLELGANFQHTHEFFNADDSVFKLPQATLIAGWTKKGWSDDDILDIDYTYDIAGKLVECGKPMGTGYYIFEKSQVTKKTKAIRDMLDVKYSNEILLGGTTGKQIRSDINGTVNNLHLMAHMYVGLGSKIKFDINKVKTELKPYIKRQSDQNQIKYIYWEEIFFKQYIKDKISFEGVSIDNAKLMTRVIWMEEDNLYILIYQNWKEL